MLAYACLLIDLKQSETSWSSSEPLTFKQSLRCRMRLLNNVLAIPSGCLQRLPPVSLRRFREHRHSQYKH
eukprot:568825-Hanusia_phi.AAC.1